MWCDRDRSSCRSELHLILIVYRRTGTKQERRVVHGSTSKSMALPWTRVATHGTPRTQMAPGRRWLFPPPSWSHFLLALSPLMTVPLTGTRPASIYNRPSALCAPVRGGHDEFDRAKGDSASCSGLAGVHRAAVSAPVWLREECGTDVDCWTERGLGADMSSPASKDNEFLSRRSSSTSLSLRHSGSCRNQTTRCDIEAARAQAAQTLSEPLKRETTSAARQ
ncbi:unnamed protein product [Pleuronectes platessa]|uniref:Uncharacterized protein n=1 Tax=Pleuronectes platessa TaxID=8262 RepID=A0A9N7VUH2_PLEPL|nr:unnamed protein product [Pleuronectes platessa]